MRKPTLILLGERDSFGRREEVEIYSLSPQVLLRWIPQQNTTASAPMLWFAAGRFAMDSGSMLYWHKRLGAAEEE